MSEPWPDAQARERYVRFLEMELDLMKAAAEPRLDTVLLAEINDFMTLWFPRTKAFIASRLATEETEGIPDEVMAVAWAEARAVPAGESASRVPGEWTEKEIASDINQCFAEARRRAGL